MDIEHFRRTIRPLASAEGLRLVVLFGSAARKAEPARDLDLGIDAGGPCDTVDLTNRLITLLGRSDVDIADLRRADPVLLRAVAEDGIPLYEAERGQFGRFHSLAVRRFLDTRKLREMEHREIHDRLERLESLEPSGSGR